MLSWLKENGGSLSFSILLSLTIWVVAVRQQNPIEQRSFPNNLTVQVQDISPGLVVSGDYTHEVRVSLRAPRSTWNTISANDISVVADLSGLSPGTHQVDLQVILPPHLQAVNARAEPPQTTITLEEERRRQMPVQVSLVGEPSVGFGTGQPVVEPDSVQVSGPVSQVDRVSEVSVGVDVREVRDTVQVELDASVLDSGGSPVPDVEVSPSRVRVTVPIDRLPDYKEVAVIVNQEGTAPAFGYYVSSINVSPVTVTVQGPPDAIDQMPGFVRTALVDLTGVRESFTRTVGLELPAGVVAVDTSVVEVTVQIDAFRGSVSVRQPLEVVGLGQGLEAVLSPDGVDIILSGSLAVLDQLSQNQVRVVLDLSGMTVGTYQIAPQVIALPEGVTNESLLPATIEVQIRRATPTR